MRAKPIIYYGYNVKGKPQPFSQGAYVVAKQGSKWFSFTPGLGLNPLGEEEGEDYKDYRAFVRKKIWLPFAKLPENFSQNS